MLSEEDRDSRIGKGEREMREEGRGRTKKWISLLDGGKGGEGIGVKRKGWSEHSLQAVCYSFIWISIWMAKPRFLLVSRQNPKA